MNTLIDKPKSARYADGVVTVTMETGSTLCFPVRGNPRLENATAAQLQRIELSPFGLHWPDLDEDLSLEGIRAGRYGQKMEA
jgi:Protein of unknown function (DUF2442)